MLRSTQLKRQRAEAFSAMRKIRETAKAAGRDLTSAEQAEWDRLDDQMRFLNLELEEALAEEDGQRSGPLTVIGEQGASGNGSVLERAWGLQDLGSALIGPGQSVREWAERRGLVKPAERGVSFGQYLHAVATGDFAAAGSLMEGIGPQGGYLVPLGISSQVLDMARARSVVNAAGARTLISPTPEYHVPRLSSDPSASWVAEGDVIPEAAMAFEQITATAHKLTALAKPSTELVDDVEELQSFVSSVFAEVLALALDFGALRGDGIGKPLGVRSWSGVSIVSMGVNGSTPTSFNHIVDAVTAIRQKNFEPRAWIQHPRDAGVIAKLADTTGQPKRPPDDVDALARFTTTQLPTDLVQGTANTASEAFVGDFSMLAFVVRLGFRLEVLRERYRDEGRLGLLAEVRADAMPLREGAFAIVSGLLP